MIDVRLRSRITDAELEQKIGKLLTDDDYNLLLTRDAFVRKPDGSPLAVYLRGVVPPEVYEQAYPILHRLRASKTNNRGQAAGAPVLAEGKHYEREKPVYGKGKAVASAIVGSFEAAASKQWCRLTAFTRDEVEQWQELFPLFTFIAEEFARHVPERYVAQSAVARKTDEAWVVPGTPFTTITVNNSYPTGVHTDKGDLDEGFSNLFVIRRGEYSGGRLCFPRFRVAVDMQEGDLLLMDAHEWHGNTPLYCACGDRLDSKPCEKCEAERISVVCYFRTNMAKCGSPASEAERQKTALENRNAAREGE